MSLILSSYSLATAKLQQIIQFTKHFPTFFSFFCFSPIVMNGAYPMFIPKTKKNMADALLEGGNISASLSREEMVELLKTAR